MENKALILTKIENGIHKVILNRPSKKNAFNSKMYIELAEILTESAHNEAVTVTVITGNGDFYSSGHDFISSMASFDKDKEMAYLRKFIDALILYPKLLIAIVNGPAIGIAATTLALFDIIYASDTVYFLTPFCKLGISPEGCSTYTFPKILGPSKTGEMLYFGQKLSAIEAVQTGFVSKVYKANKVHEVWKHLENISSLSKESLAATKRLLSRWNKNLLLEVNREELLELEQRYSSPDFGEKMTELMLKKSKM